MAIQLMQENGEYNINRKHFLLDTEDEFIDLENSYECSMGDIVELVDGTIYYRHSSGYNGDLWEINESSGGTNKLPEVNSEDNGKILKVDNGRWIKDDNFYTLNEIYKTIIEEQIVTTVEVDNNFVSLIEGNFNEVDDTKNLLVTFNNYSYNVILNKNDHIIYIGEIIDGTPDFSNLPFLIIEEEGVTTIFTEEANDYIIKIEQIINDIIPNEEFSIAVKNIINTQSYGEEDYETILDTTSYTTVEDNGYYKCDNVCSLASLVDGDIVKVTFDGNEYEVKAKVSRYGKSLGDNVNNFANYPFYINTGTFPGTATLYTEEAGTYSIKIERKVVTSSKEFSDATLASIKYIKFMTTQLLSGTQITCNYSRDEVWGMFEDEAPVIASIDGVLCAQGMKFLYPNMIQFRVLDFTSDNNTPVLKERIISVNEYNTPEFSYSENLYNLYEYNSYPS